MAKIIGGTVATPMKIADLAQKNPLKADYVKGKHLVANSINCTASGNPIRLDDVSPLEHEMAVGVKSKNKFFATTDKTYSSVGLTLITTKGSSSFVLNGTTTAASAMQITSGVPLKAGTYTVSLFGANITKNYDTDRIYVEYKDESGATKLCNYILDGSPKTFTIANDQEVAVQFIFASGSVYENKEVSIQIEEGTTATAYTPYIDVNGASVNKLGKNIWRFEDMTYLANYTVKKTETGFKAAGASGTAYVYGSYRWLPISALDGKELVISCTMTPSGNNKPTVAIGYCDENGTTPSGTPSLEMKASGSVSFAIDSTKANGCKYIKFTIYKNAGSTESTASDYIDYSNFQIEIGNATAYEPYHSETYTADENGKVNGIIGNGEDITLMGDGVTITAEYNADTKKYIDKKFAELQALVLEV